MQFAKLLFVCLFLYGLSACGSDTTSGNHTSSDVRNNQFKIPVDTSSHKTDLPEQLGFVNDFENLLTQEQIVLFGKLIRDFEKKTGNEISVVTVANFTPHANISEYAKTLFNHWGIGKKDLDNGLMLILSKNKQQIRITTGLGIEKILTNAACQEIIDQVIVPRLNEGDFAKGIYDGLQAIMARWGR